MSYTYLAYNSAKALVNGRLKAKSEDEAESILVNAGYRPLVIRSQGESLGARLSRGKRLKARELITITEQLAVLVRAGIPLVSAMESVRDQKRNPEFAAALEQITEDVRAGSPLSKAMGKYPKYFPNLYVQMVLLGERSGDIEGMLDQIATYYGKELALRQRVQRVMFYPALVMGMAAVVGIFMVTYVLPKIITIFDKLNVPLPLMTRIVLGASKFITNNQAMLAALVLALVLGIWVMFRQPKTRARLHRLALRLPLVSGLVIYRELGRFSRTASIMLKNGLPLTEVLQMSSKTANNLEVRGALLHAHAEVTAGRPLSTSLAAAPFMPPMFLRMVRVGEMSGNLESNLNSMAAFYERELDTGLESALALLEPALTIGIGFIIGGVALSVISPIYSIVGHGVPQ
ncbi:MAG: type II secretion system F family protein [Chloroflexi bacterium]|nr:type II secretion system F family protein [Chloroflexota bacterium]